MAKIKQTPEVIRYGNIDALIEAIKSGAAYVKLNIMTKPPLNKINLLASAIAESTNLQHVDISQNDIGPAGAVKLAEALQINKSLKLLFISSNKIGDDGAKAMLKALEKNTILERFDIGCQLGQIKVETIVSFIENTNLKGLGIHNCNLGCAEVTEIAAALKKSTRMQHLDIYTNRIGETGATAIAEALKINTSLQQLDISNNKIGNAGATAIAEALKINTSIKKLVIDNNNISPNHSHYLRTVIKDKVDRNTKLDTNLNSEPRANQRLNAVMAIVQQAAEKFDICLPNDPAKVIAEFAEEAVKTTPCTPLRNNINTDKDLSKPDLVKLQYSFTTNKTAARAAKVDWRNKETQQPEGNRR
ncbi:MAG: hypothetical protein K0R98_876 [Rickettsiaceae bacterium]|jgi:hypothetical protein|nr:hypothetical protein [Rickettsiaceae bacterium]